MWMRWTRGYRSDDVEDRRGEDPGPGGPGLPAGAILPLVRNLGVGGTLLVLAVLFIVNRAGSCSSDQATVGSPAAQRTAGHAAQNDEAKQFVSYVLDDVQRTWEQTFRREGRPYQHAHLVLYSGRTATACGQGAAAAGPFYCPSDEKVYIDLSFYDELRTRFGAPGDFAQAYVIAHEMGHHVQTLLGLRSRSSVEFELQADCLAGVWASSSARRELLDPGDIEEALGAAAAVGDDRLQRAAGEAVNPETWTHGSSAQRKAAFQRGYRGGTTQSCGAR
jgi:uncharacterized protein